MVKFGERLVSLKQRGWEQHYVDYEALKRSIEDEGQTSSDFMALLEKELSKMDSFVTMKTNELKQSVDSADAVASKLAKTKDDLTLLRHFVGTNIIAATKIVKKHDKNAEPTQQLRERVAAVIRGLAGITAVPPFQQQLELALQRAGRPSSPSSVAIDMLADPLLDDNDEDTDATLRSLPGWLLAGAADDEESARRAVVDTFLADWNLDGSDGEAEPLVRAAAEGSEEWEVDFSSDALKWGEMNTEQKCRKACEVSAKLVGIVFFLYAFICSLSFLADGFRLVGGKQAGEIFRNSEVFNNPIAAMLVGVLVTVLVQSSSTSTSIVITMVAADLFTVMQAIYIIMGANIGTSVTSTIVALGQSSDKKEFRRAFAAATVHDMFNFLCVLILLPLEAATGYLYKVTEGIVKSLGLESGGEKPPDMLKTLTKPFTKMVISIDKKLITKIAVADTPEELAELEAKPMLKHLFGAGPEEMTDTTAGIIALVGSLLLLCIALFAIVTLLKSLLQGRIAVWLHRSVNGNVPDLKCGGLTIPLGWLSGYLAIIAGLVLTILVQSSSITTSALTPLVGVGVIQLERMYPTVLGANIGTCVTGVLAALAASSDKLYLTLQVALAHLFFNFSGIFIFYVIWPLRALPITAAKFMGNTTAIYRWFAVAYLFVAFFIVPFIFMGLSLASPAVCVVVAVLCVLVFIAIATINTLQARRPDKLPPVLRSWDFLPEWLRSLAPLDRVVCVPLDRVICVPLGNMRRACCSALPCMASDKKTSSRANKKPADAGMAKDLEVAADRLQTSSA